MSLKFNAQDGSTPLEAEELEKLIPDHITTMGQLNELEQLNIAGAVPWAISSKYSNILTPEFAKKLHNKMFSDVWKWAGKFRTYGVNIGNTDASEIRIRFLSLFDNTQHWKDENTYESEEIAVRFHHELTLIHAFPNGNGRHARLMTDVLLNDMGEAPFTWGGGAGLVHRGDEHESYLAALRVADKEYEYQPLLTFVRS